jgi:2-polyprenyl-3-methyl-5-hydroxy-6-metoxy-1,4-benzoquinol methylase
MPSIKGTLFDQLLIRTRQCILFVESTNSALAKGGSSPMAVIKDPEGNETATLHAMVDFKDQRVLEVGCGEGRLTWRYAGKTAHVTGIDPDRKSVETARADVPENLKERVHFFASTIEEFATSFSGRKFDIAIYSWSL